MSSLCIAFLTSTLSITLPTSHITLRWTHSVERVPWEEEYSVFGNGVQITEARVIRSGAGMEAPSDARWSDERWRYVPRLHTFAEVRLANSKFVNGYEICWDGQCQALDVMVPKGEVTTL